MTPADVQGSRGNGESLLSADAGPSASATHSRLVQRLEALIEACTEPMTAFDSFSTLFRKPIRAGELQMATGEAMAHLHWLHRRGQLERIESDSAVRYRRFG